MFVFLLAPAPNPFTPIAEIGRQFIPLLLLKLLLLPPLVDDETETGNEPGTVEGEEPSNENDEEVENDTTAELEEETEPEEFDSFVIELGVAAVSSIILIVFFGFPNSH